MKSCPRCTLETVRATARCGVCNFEFELGLQALPKSSLKFQSSISGFIGFQEVECPGSTSARVRVAVEIIPGASVLRHAIGREVRSWSKLYVPLIFSALEHIPPAAASCLVLSGKQTPASREQIARAQSWWRERFSLWPSWVQKVRALVASDPLIVEDIVLNPRPKGKTALVFSDAQNFGWLPHVCARNQERIMAMAGIDGEIATCVASSMQT